MIHGYIYSQFSQGCQMSGNCFIKKHVIFRWAGKRAEREVWNSLPEEHFKLSEDTMP